MLLAIDCGNTNTDFSILDGKRVLCTLRTATEHQRTADQYYVWLSTLLSHHRIPLDINAVIISTTVPRVVFNLRVLSDRYFHCRPLVVGKPECLLPRQPRVDEGTVVGPDRLVNSAGAFDKYGGNLIVVDFGTATTFDVVAEDGAYVGGVIAPGVNLSLQALHEMAAALPHVDITKPQGERISEMTLLKTGEAIEPARTYQVAGWASVNEGTEGPMIWDVVESHIKKLGTVTLDPNTSVEVIQG